MGKEGYKNNLCYDCRRRSFRGAYCDLHGRIIEKGEYLDCMNNPEFHLSAPTVREEK